MNQEVQEEQGRSWEERLENSFSGYGHCLYLCVLGKDEGGRSKREEAFGWAVNQRGLWGLRGVYILQSEVSREGIGGGLRASWGCSVGLFDCGIWMRDPLVGLVGWPVGCWPGV